MKTHVPLHLHLDSSLPIDFNLQDKKYIIDVLTDSLSPSPNPWVFIFHEAKD